MEANLSLKVTGVKGNSPKYTQNTGRVVTFIDNNSENYIAIDAFCGYGDKNSENPYKRREKCEIQINIGSQSWEGTIEDLEKIVFKK